MAMRQLGLINEWRGGFLQRVSGVLIMMLIQLGSSPDTDAAPQDDVPPFSNGTVGLFIGHSFFAPVAKAFDEIAAGAGYSDHAAEVVFASGARGAPGALWNSPRHKSKIEDTLEKGRVQLLGMTAFGGINSSVEDYQRWIDLALSYNAATSFLIAAPWMAGGPRMNTERYDGTIVKTGGALFERVEQLRRDNPGVSIFYLNYGKAASVMKSRFEDEDLADVQRLAGGPKSLFADRLMGHAGEMMTKVAALYWLHKLYGPVIEDLPSLGYVEEDVQAILGSVDEFNREHYDFIDHSQPEREPSTTEEAGND